MPWTVAGEHGALFGRQSGKFESWQWPVKLISNFSIRAELADYPVPIDVNALAAEIEVTPAETIITYSHAAFTIRQHMFAARGFDLPPTAAVVFFEIQSARALELSFSFTPDMLPMWPAPGHGRPNGEWVKYGDSGFYVLHTDDPKFSGLVAMPRTQPGIEVPYQEHPQTYPLELKLRFDPKTDDGLLFPLITSVLQGTSGAEQVSRAVAGLPELYHKTVAYYQHFFDDKLTIETPDARLDDALRWAEVAIDQAQVMHHNEIGLVAGYYESADSARPGYAWFFGRDTLWTTYAINSYGDFALTRRALDFLFKRQRGDGKIMHEYSQSADVLDWKQTPYFYASADSTPLLVMAMWDYVKNSGDVAYLKANWSAIQKAYQFTLAHTADNGIYSNSEGTGWVESWPTGMPHQEIYLAALDQQSANAMENLALIMKDDGDASAAQSRASATAAKVESEFYNSDQRFYAFSRNPDGSLDNTATVYPAVAWWNGGFALKNPGPMLTRWASAEFSADWGTRDISNRTSFYDPISYHQGSIWPLFTGWVSLAEYRAGRSLSGYAHMMQNANLTWTQDLGSVTELLSGEFFQPLGRSSSHQLWSSAMVLSPLLRGLFGLDPNALRNTLHLSPNVPAEWDHAILHHVRVGATNFDLCFQRQGTRMHVTAKNIKGNAICLSEPRTPCRADYSKSGQFSYELPPIELSIATSLPPPGSETAQLKVLDQQRKDDSATFVLEAQGGSSYSLFLRPNRPDVSVEGGQIVGGRLQVTFPAGAGYRRQTLTFHWKKS
ncbi:MAG TPA: glycogen debranching protein [Bryobacteraceae bacterium]|nr:glycogen debranching protein [Bryobacteraceae bacterium]